MSWELIWIRRTRDLSKSQITEPRKRSSPRMIWSKVSWNHNSTPWWARSWHAFCKKINGNWKAISVLMTQEMPNKNLRMMTKIKIHQRWVILRGMKVWPRNSMSCIRPIRSSNKDSWKRIFNNKTQPRDRNSGVTFQCHMIYVSTYFRLKIRTFSISSNMNILPPGRQVTYSWWDCSILT